MKLIHTRNTSATFDKGAKQIMMREMKLDLMKALNPLSKRTARKRHTQNQFNIRRMVTQSVDYQTKTIDNRSHNMSCQNESNDYLPEIANVKRRIN